MAFFSKLKERLFKSSSKLEEGLEEFNLDIPVVGLSELIADHLVDKKPAGDG